jgi:mannose-6-phosphate isomerase-like protein (cupin superfamily)
MKQIQSYSYDAPGYDPTFISDGWQAAFLNYSPDEALESIVKLDIHHQTDEVFVLLRGRAVLIAATIAGGVSYDLVDMLPGVIYNIPRETWHKIAMYEGSSVCIVEKNNTHVSDFDFYDLSPSQREELQEAVNNLNV